MADFKKLAQLLGDLDEEGVLEFANELVASGASESDGLAAVAACQDGMNIVGDLFEKGEYFVGDLIFAGEILTETIQALKPILSSGTGNTIGKIIVGTVHGDLHDIGKNIFKNMIEIAGFEVFDLGIDQSPEAFVEKAKEVKPDIIGLSGVLTLALDSMKSTVEALQAAGIKDDIKVIIGGNPVTKEACEYIGADAFTTNAAEGVRICRGWVNA
ncbi:MAG: cobalamin-dependent protein [Eubacteriaceae bacterium]|nr:cobalamin-dependent protein [Eubacteriaceae bacterium]